MAQERPRALKGHLTPDQVELCATGEPERTLPEALEAHVRHCAACRREVASLTTLHTHLRNLPYLNAPPGFAERVMSRVKLPVPWHQRAWSTVRRRWAVLGAGLGTAGGMLGGTAYWLFGKQALTPSQLFAFILDGLQTAGLRLAMAGGRVLYDSGLLDLIRTVVEQVALPQAAAAMAVLSLTGFGALWTMKRLMETDTSRLPRVVHR